MHVSHDRPHRGSTRFIGLWALALVACTRARTPVAPQTSEAPRVVTAGARCLPVVSDECGCVYPCAAGEPRSSGAFSVRAARWTSALEARVADWCVAGQCTPAFHVALVCDGICERRPADATCAFRAGRCETGRADAALDGAYQVRWRRGGAVAGVVSLEEGRYTWVGRAPDPGGRTFAFVARPNGRYTTEMRAGSGDGDVLGVVDFAPGDSAIPEAERRVEVRRDPARRVRFFHSVVSELELWQIETLP
ncbi:MAG: hypothetical protein JNK05_32365 [Myxococcales bacterium]|nr:hypothetical protein [Myxococcales bacterium]